MDQPVSISAAAPNDQLKHHPNPFNGKKIVWDTCEALSHEEAQCNALLGMGFEPYAVTMTPDPRKDVQAAARLQGGLAMSQKMWFKRPREVTETPTNQEIK